MMLLTVRIINRDGEECTQNRFTVLMHRVPNDSTVDIESFHDEVRDKVRKHEAFKSIEKFLPSGYRMDVDVVILDENFVGIIGV